MIRIAVDSVYARVDVSGHNADCAKLSMFRSLSRAAISSGNLHQGQHVVLIDLVGALWHTASMFALTWALGHVNTLCPIWEGIDCCFT